MVDPSITAGVGSRTIAHATSGFVTRNGIHPLLDGSPFPSRGSTSTTPTAMTGVGRRCGVRPARLFVEDGEVLGWYLPAAGGEAERRDRSSGGFPGDEVAGAAVALLA